MNRKIKLLAWSLVLLFTIFQLPAQKAKNVDINSLSDQQIQMLVQQATMQGLTFEQALQMAKAQGATPEQIEQITMRVKGISETGSTKDRTTQKKRYIKDKNGNLVEDDSYESDYSEKAKFEASEKLKKIFGFNFFNSDKLSFEPSVNIPVPKDYALGVNDELTINVWGGSQQTYQVTVDQSGSIYVQGLGQISLLGTTLEDARRIIKQRLRTIYSGMTGSNPNTWAEISISNLRSIKVNVIGEVMAPGTYTLPATASAFNALYLSGGPSEFGSFRNIRVIRDNKVIKVLDVYDYLINSETKSNIALRDQDVIYVPTYDIRVDMQGATKRNGYFELKKGETLDKLLKYSGGFASGAYKSSVSVTRITESQKSIVDVSEKQYSSFLPLNGDSITAGEVIDRYENRISITGAVYRPGVYALSPEMKLSELIKKAQGLTEDVFNNRGIIYRLGKDLTPYAVAFDVTEVMGGKNDPLLQREDSVVIQDIFSMREKRYVRVFGEVQRQGEYPFYEGMTINDLIFKSGGLKESASESFIEISRRHSYEEAAGVSNKLVELFKLKVSRDLRLSDDDKRFYLMPFDYVYIRRAPSYFEQKTVTIEGEVLYPGQYSISSKNERVSDLIRRSGGLTAHAYVHGATLFRNTEKEKKDTTILENLGIDTLTNKATKQLTDGRVELQLDKIMKDTASIYNYHLKDGDRVVIPEVSEEVKVIGEILNPVGLAYEPRKNAKYYIDRSGGFSDKANTKKVYVINSDGTTKVTKTFIFTSYPDVQPGSKIIVPEKPEKDRMDASMWLAIASTFSSIAVAIAAILR